MNPQWTSGSQRKTKSQVHSLQYLHLEIIADQQNKICAGEQIGRVSKSCLVIKSCLEKVLHHQLISHLSKHRYHHKVVVGIPSSSTYQKAGRRGSSLSWDAHTSLVLLTSFSSSGVNPRCPRPAGRHRPANVSRVFPGASFQWDRPGFSLCLGILFMKIMNRTGWNSF